MGRMQIVISDQTEKGFREEVFKRLGFKKGNMSIAMEEAIKNWINARQQKRTEAAKKAWVKRKNEHS